MANVMKNVSPELALVDPDLADLARSGLPETGGYVPPRMPRSPRLDSAPRLPSAAEQRGARPKAIAFSRVLSALVVVVAALLTLVGADSIPSGPHLSAPSPTPTVSTAQISTPPSQARNVVKPRKVQIRWAASRRADLYNLVFLRDGKRIDIWPTKNAVTIVGTRISGARKRLTVGRYTWFAYAGFRTGQRVRYGPLIDHGTVRVPRPR